MNAISYELRGGATCDRLSGGGCKAVRVTLQLERSGAGVMLLRIILPALANAGISRHAVVTLARTSRHVAAASSSRTDIGRPSRSHSCAPM